MTSVSSVSADQYGAMTFCTTCGERMAKVAQACPKCGAPNVVAGGGNSEKSFVAALLLCFFLGAFGIHRFYVGKIGTGILMLLTLGGLGIWALIDFIIIAIGSFKDAEGRRIRNN